jgi:hypothetical protein
VARWIFLALAVLLLIMIAVYIASIWGCCGWRVA